jgi:hypothetical protein
MSIGICDSSLECIRLQIRGECGFQQAALCVSNIVEAFALFRLKRCLRASGVSILATGEYFAL